MVLVKNLNFFHLFILGLIGQENVFVNILERKKGLLDSKIKSDETRSVTLPAQHQSEAAFVGECSFSKLWASVSFFPFPFSRHSLFFALI